MWVGITEFHGAGFEGPASVTGTCTALMASQAVILENPHFPRYPFLPTLTWLENMFPLSFIGLFGLLFFFSFLHFNEIEPGPGTARQALHTEPHPSP